MFFRVYSFISVTLIKSACCVVGEEKVALFIESSFTEYFCPIFVLFESHFFTSLNKYNQFYMHILISYLNITDNKC